MVPVTDLNRLGKPGSYRLGRLRVQGTGPAGPPPPLRPRFRRPRHQGPTSLWLLAAAAGVAVIAAGAAAGLWFVPLAAGLVAGLANRIGGWRARVLVPAVAVMAIVGWGIPLWWPALHGQRAGGTAPVIAALAALPASATAGVLLTLLVGVLQALAGLLLGRTLTRLPRPEIPDAAAADVPAEVLGAEDLAPSVLVAGDLVAGDARAAAAGAAAGDAAVAGAAVADADGGSGRQPGPAARPLGHDRP